MNAAGILRTLVSLGVTIKGLVAGHTNNGVVDWTGLATSALGDATIGDDIRTMLTDLQASNLGSAIAEIETKQKALLSGRSLPQLSNTEMLQFDDLADAKLVLATSQLKAALDSGFAQWLLEKALPLLKTVVPIVLPLLL